MKAENLGHATALIKELQELHRAKFHAELAEKERSTRSAGTKFEIKPYFSHAFSLILSYDFFNEAIDKRCNEIYSVLNSINVVDYETYDIYKARASTYQ